jgi:hypothetical protein
MISPNGFVAFSLYIMAIDKERRKTDYIAPIPVRQIDLVGLTLSRKGLNVKTSLRIALRAFGLATLALCALGFSTRADVLSYTTTVYYIGPPADGADNTLGPGGTTLSNEGGDPISTFNGAISNTGAVETITFNTSGNPGVNIGAPGQDFDIQLYGPDPALSSPSSMISGGALQPGTYVFDSCSPSNYFGIKAIDYPNASAAGCNNSTVPCQTGEICNVGSSPSDIATITIGPNGVVTVQSGSLDVGFAPTPELSTLFLFGTGLLGIAYVLRKRSFVL